MNSQLETRNPKTGFHHDSTPKLLALVRRHRLLAMATPFAAVAITEENTWTVDLNSSGGFTGRGGGGAHITSQGIVHASRFNVMSPRHRPCRSQLSDEDLQKMAQAVSSTKGSTWKSSYVPDGDNGCCDRFHWTLLLYQRAPDGAGRTYGTDWYDGNEKWLPDDLATLRATILTIMKTALKGCAQ